MNKLMYRFVATTKKKKRNRPVLRHGMPPQGIPRNKLMYRFVTTRKKKKKKKKSTRF